MHKSLRQLLTITAIATLTLGLTACATTENYATTVYSWQGVNITKLYTQWGYPNSTQNIAGGHKLVVYQRVSTVTKPTTVTQSSNSQSHTDGSHSHNSTTVISPSQTTTYRCTTTFETNSEGTIINTSFKGNSCTADDFFVQSHGYGPALPQQNTSEQ